MITIREVFDYLKVFIISLVLLPFLLVYSLPIGIYTAIKEWNISRKRRSIIETSKTRREAKLNLIKESVSFEKLKSDEHFCGVKTSKENFETSLQQILDKNFEQLREALHTGNTNAYTVLCAYVWRALQVNLVINCITEMIEEAFDEAIQLDKDAAEGKPKGPLFGVPFSVKSNFYIKDYDATNGLSGYLDKPADHTCGLVEFLKSQGAVPFCLTNVPQGLLSYVTANPLYGITKNPWNFSRTAGGSSGGEGAIVAAGGSIFGIGNDLVGSLRIPAAFCGLVTLKPTQQRLFENSMNPGFEGRGRLGMSSGFFTRNVKDQEFLLNLTIGNYEFWKSNPYTSKGRLMSTELNNAVEVFNLEARNQDARSHHSVEHAENAEAQAEGADNVSVSVNGSEPQQPHIEPRKYKIGYFTDDGFNQVAPSNIRAVTETLHRLKREHTVKEFKLADVSPEFTPFQIADMLFRNVMPDNGAYMSSLYSSEHYQKEMARFIRLVRLNQNMLVRLLLDAFMQIVMKSPLLNCLAHARNDGLNGLRKNQEMTDKFQKAWIRYWKKNEFDVLTCPSFITPAQPFEYPGQLSTGVFITGLFNMLDCPAGIVPVPAVRVHENDTFEHGDDYLLKRQKEAIMNSAELPNAVQIVALPNDEEMCLEMMRIVEQAVAREDRPPSMLKWIRRNTDVFENNSSQICFDRVPKDI